MRQATYARKRPNRAYARSYDRIHWGPLYVPETREQRKARFSPEAWKIICDLESDFLAYLGDPKDYALGFKAFHFPTKEPESA